MEPNKPLDEQEQKQLIEIMQIFMQLPGRDNLDLRFYADASGSLHKEGTSRLKDEIVLHFHDLEEGVEIMRNYAHPEQEDEESNLFLEPDPALE